MSTFEDTVQLLAKIRPWDVPVNPDIQNHIITLYNNIHGEGGETFVERESRYINRGIVEDKKKWNVTSLSVFLAFVDLAVKDLTLEGGAQVLCYLLNRSVKMPSADGKDVYENRCYISITGYGEILLRQRAGQILHCDSPTVVYEGDAFTYEERGGRKVVSYSLNLNHNSAHPIACFMKITRADGTSDYAIILPEAWKRLEGYSIKQNNGKFANALYTANDGAIDPGFLIAKCVKHAFKNYPKLPVGKGMVMEADLSEHEEQENLDNYTIAEQPKAEPQDFAEPADLSEGVTVDPSTGEVTDDGTF